MALPGPYFAERMEFGGPRFAEELVPGIRSESRDTREPCLYATEIDRAKNSRKVSAERAHCYVALAVRLDTDDEEYRCAGEGRKNGLRNWCWLFAGYAHIHAVDPYLTGNAGIQLPGIASIFACSETINMHISEAFAVTFLPHFSSRSVHFRLKLFISSEFSERIFV